MKGGGQIDCLPGKATLEKPSFSRINGFPEKIYNTKYKYEIENRKTNASISNNVWKQK